MTSQGKERDKKPFISWKSWLIQLAVALLLVGGIILLRDLPQEPADRLRAIDDAFSIIALLYLCIGSLLWVSTTGFFDIFGFAVRRALHALIPGMVRDTTGDYYEYQEEHRRKRRERSLKSTFFAGLFLLAVSIVLTVCWYEMYG